MDSTRVQQHQESRTLGMVSLVLGVAGFLPIPGIIASALALVCGYLSRGRSRAEGSEVSGMATAGIILGWTSLVIFTVVMVVYFGILGYPLPEIHRYHPGR